MVFVWVFKCRRDWKWVFLWCRCVKIMLIFKLCKEEIPRDSSRNWRFREGLFQGKVEGLGSPQQFCFDRPVFFVFSWVNIHVISCSPWAHLYIKWKKKKITTDFWAKNWSVEVWVYKAHQYALLCLLWILRALERHFYQECLWVMLFNIFVEWPGNPWYFSLAAHIRSKAVSFSSQEHYLLCSSPSLDSISTMKSCTGMLTSWGSPRSWGSLVLH